MCTAPAATEGWTLLTGGNRGLGLGLARKLALDGRKVLLASRTLPAAKKAADAIAAATPQHPGCVRPLELNVADRRSCSQAVQHVRDNFDQQISMLINNAGVYEQAWDKSTFDLAVATNFRGPVDLVLSLLPHLEEGARVVNVSSELGSLHYLSAQYGNRVAGADSIEELLGIGFDPDDQQQAGGAVPTYRLTKAMLNRATQLLSRDERLHHRGVTCSVVTPGWCQTDMGGPSAPRTPQQGVGSIWFNISYPDAEAISGGFFIDGRPQCW